MGRRSETSFSTWRWFAQATLGILLFILLAVHLLVNHWVAPQGLLTYADVLRYYDVPGIALMEILFLVVVTTHCLIGVHAILLDLELSARTIRLLSWTLVVVGLVTIAYGFRLTWIVATL